MTYSFCNAAAAGSHPNKDQRRAGWDQLGCCGMGVDQVRAGGRGAKGLPLAFDLAGGQEFAFVGGSLNQFLPTENFIPETI